MRQRTSLRRRNMEAMANSNQLQSLKKHNLDMLTQSLLLTVALVIVVFVKPNDNALCSLNSNDYLKNYLYWVELPLCIIRPIMQYLIKDTNCFLLTFIFTSVVFAIADTVFFYIGIVNIFDSDCWSPMDINFLWAILIILLVLRVAIFVSILGGLFICCLPCFCTVLFNHRQNLA